jgi:arylsulfatase A-like enzyme
MLHVPLVLAGPDIPRGRVIDKQVSLIDLAPTIADLCGVMPPEEFQGTSLLPVIQGGGSSRAYIGYYDRRLVDGEMAPEGETFLIRSDGWKLIEREVGPELYRLEHDPGEKHNLAEENPQVVQSLRTRLTEEVSRLRQDQIELDPVDLREQNEIQERLRALGYID